MAFDMHMLRSRGIEIGLRLPPLYLMDIILLRNDIATYLLSSIFLSSSKETTVVGKNGHGHSVRISEASRYANPVIDSLKADEMIRNAHNGSFGDLEDVYSKLYGNPDLSIIPHLFNLIVSIWLYLASIFVITLSTRHLIIFYTYLGAFLTIPFSIMSHRIMSEALQKSESDWLLHRYFCTFFSVNISIEIRAIISNYVIQSTLSLFLSSILRFHFDNYNLLFKVLTVSMLSPIVFAIVGVPWDFLTLTSFLSALLPLTLCGISFYFVFGKTIRVVANTFLTKRQFVQNFGLNTFLETEWARLRVPSLLRTFWMTRIVLHLGLLLPDFYKNNGFDVTSSLSEIYDHTVFVGKEVVTQGADTFVAVLGMTSIVSTICHYIGAFFYLILNGDEEDEKSVASISAVLFFVLALQSGLTNLEPNKRFSRLCKNLCLLLTALFHFIHNMVNPVLMSLSASHNYNTKKHLRALGICVFLVVAPISLLVSLWQSFSAGTWLLAVTTFCAEVVVKVTVTVCVYLLFLYDLYFREGAWEFLDDAVYYVKAVGSSIEFCFAVFLFLNGGWIFVFENGGTIRAVMMLIHAYCNIWLEAKSGWQMFIKRRTAASKINSLTEAKPAELEAHNDVCAICYQEMSSARVTRCKHYFHGVCLRKWLYVQDTCPLCHATLYYDQGTANSTSTGTGNEGFVHIQDQIHNERDRNIPDYANNDGNPGNYVENPAVQNVDEIIDNDDLLDEQVNVDDEEDDIGIGDPDLSDDFLRRRSSTSSSEIGPSDNDLIYDSMEDYGDSSSAPEDCESVR